MALAAMGGANNSSTNAMFPEAWLVTYACFALSSTEPCIWLVFSELFPSDTQTHK